MSGIVNIRRIFGVVLLAIVLGCSVLGIITITKTPVLVTKSGDPLTGAEISHVRNIAGITIPPEYFLRLPEFRTVAKERQWWAVQSEVSDVVASHSSVVVTLAGLDKRRQIQRLKVVYPDIYQAIMDSWPLYLAVLLYCLVAWSIYNKHDSQAGAILAVFCLSGALFFATAIPIVSRGIALPFPQFRWLIDINYVADSGLVTIVHFVFLFPKRKALLDRWHIPWVIYSYFIIVNFLYLAGITSYDASMPFLYFWCTVLILAFVHSMIREKDPFLRRQVFVSFAVAALVVVVFVVFNADPVAMGPSSARFAMFAVFALLMPFALMAAMDNIRLYRQRLAAETLSYQEREKVRQELHDDTLNKLGNIALLSETSLHMLDQHDPQVRDKIQSIKRQATSYSQTIRQLLSITDKRYGSWQDFASLLRSYGYEAAAERDVDFDLDFITEMDGKDRPTTAMTVTLYHIFVEALSNAFQHANPRSVKAELRLDRDSVSLKICDDGGGFQVTESKPGHYGLNNMTRRAQAIGGVVSFDSHPGHGICIKATLPRDKRRDDG